MRKRERFYELMYIRSFLRKIMNDIPCSRPSWVVIPVSHGCWLRAFATLFVSKRAFSAWPFDYSSSWETSKRRPTQRAYMYMSHDRSLQPHDLTTGPTLAIAARISVCSSSYPRALTPLHPSRAGADFRSSGKSVSFPFHPPGSASIATHPASWVPCLCRPVARRHAACADPENAKQVKVPALWHLSLASAEP